MSQAADIAVVAFGKGYRVSEAGELVTPEGKTRKLVPDHNGYLSASLLVPSVASTPRRLIVHKLAAYQKFKDKAFVGNTQVRHLNGNKTDNSLSNIKIGTPKENIGDIPKEVRVAAANVARKALSKKCRPVHEQVMADHEKGMSHRQLARKYGKAKSTISYIVNKKGLRRGSSC